MAVSRCRQHDLALGPDGMCVVCRRESRAPARVPGWIFVLGGLTLLCLGGVFVLKSLPPPAPTPERVAANPEGNPVEPVRPQPPARARPTPTPPVATTAPSKQVPITMYSTTWCPHCERARRWFQSNAIPFVEYDIEANSAAKSAQRKLNPKGGVPTIDIDGTVEVGFSEQRVQQAIARSLQRRQRERSPATRR